MPEAPHDREFEAALARPRRSAAGELAAFLRHNKKWWLTPIVISVLLLGALVLLGGGAAPFLYTLF